MAAVYSAIVEGVAANNVYWNGTTAWGYDATSDKYNPTAHPNQAARDAQYTGGVYGSIQAWDTARDGAAQAGDDEYGIIQGQWSSADTTQVIISGWTTGTITCRAIGEARHSGTWSATAHRLELSNTNYILGILEDNVTLDGLQLHNTQTGDSLTDNIYCNGAYTLTFSGCLLSCADTGGNGMQLNNAGLVAYIYNNIIWCPHTQGPSSEGIWLRSVDAAYIYNNTIYNFDDGIEVDAVNTAVEIKNNIIFTNADDIDDAVGVTIDYNATDDGDGDHSQAPSGADWANEMSGYADFDFTLDGAGNCYDNGETNPGTGLYDDDIEGTARTVSWSIGAFEYDVPTGATIIPQCTSYYNRIRSVSGD